MRTIRCRSTSTSMVEWPNAISAYRRDPHGGMKIIGHTLHLIQDMTVPLHVRGDIHPIDKDYEGFADLFSTRDWSRVTSGNAKLFAVYQDRIAESQWEGIQPLMRKLARYTAENFVSDDTMPNGAELKRMFEDDGRYVTRMPLAEERPYRLTRGYSRSN